MSFAIYYALSAPEGGSRVEMLRLSTRSLFSLDRYVGHVFILTDQATLPHLDVVLGEARNDGVIVPVVVAKLIDDISRARYWLPKVYKEFNRLAKNEFSSFLYLDADIISAGSLETMFFACSGHSMPLLCCGEDWLMGERGWEFSSQEAELIEREKLAELNPGQFWVTKEGFDLLLEIGEHDDCLQGFNKVLLRSGNHNVALNTFFSFSPFGSSPFVHFCGETPDVKLRLMRALYDSCERGESHA